MASTPPDFINAPPGQTEGYFQALFTSKWGKAAGDAYAKYNQNNPTKTPYENAQAFADIIAVQGLQKALQEAGKGVGKAQNQVITGTAKGAINVEKQDNPLAWLSSLDGFFRQITKLSMWRSLGWMALGVGLIAGGVFMWTRTEGTKLARGLITNPGNKPDLQAPVIPLSMIMAGIYLLWFGVSYWEDTQTIWPSDPAKNILQGKGLPARSADQSAGEILNASETAANSSSSKSSNAQGSTTPLGPEPTGTPQTQAKSLLSHFGWDASQFPALVSLWNQESGWNPKARNGTSGAFGIAQALGHGLPGGAAPDGTNEYGGEGLTGDQAKQANSGNGYWQIVWGLHYIKDRYGSPQGAWAHEQSNNWY